MVIQDYNKLTTQALVDLLAQETEKYTQLLAGKEFTSQYEEVKEKIKNIQTVIESRKETTISASNN